MSRSADFKNIYIQKYASPGIFSSWNGLKDCWVFFTLPHMLIYKRMSLKTIQQCSKILEEEEEPVLMKGLYGDPADIRKQRPFSK